MGAPFLPRGTWCLGDSYNRDFDRWKKEGSSGGASLCEGLHRGTLREGSFTGEPERWRFWEICKMPCRWTSLFIGILLGNVGGGGGVVCRDFWETRKVYPGFEKVLEKGISFHRCLVWGTWRRAHLPGTLRDGWTGLCGWSVSPFEEALWRGPGEQLLHWGPWKICWESLQMWASPWGPLSSRGEPAAREGGLVYQGLW